MTSPATSFRAFLDPPGDPPGTKTLDFWLESQVVLSKTMGSAVLGGNARV